MVISSSSSVTLVLVPDSYIDLHNGYKCLDISIGRLYIPHAIFDDNILPIIANLHPNA